VKETMNARALNILRTAKLLPLLLLLVLPAVAQAKNFYTNSFGIWTYSPSTGPITISAYSGSVSAVTIPSKINGFPVTSLSLAALAGSGMTSVTIPDSVISMGGNVFSGCSSLTSVTIGAGVTGIGGSTFSFCTSLTGVYFQGNSPTPTNDSTVFSGDTNVVVYYLPGTTGWGVMFDGFPTELWNPQAQTSGASFGVRNNQFGFNITGNSNLVVVVEGCTNLANPVWSPVSTNTVANGTNYFSDPQWTNYPARFYRLSSQ
jgi:hypothetical protein